MRKYSVLALFLSLTMLSGCSIKEKRDGCPCRLFLDMTSVDAADQVPFVISVFSDEGFEYREIFDSQVFMDTCIVEVPRSELDIVVWSGGGDYLDDEGLKIPLGEGCPPVFIHQSRVEAKGEAVYDVVRMNKNFCILSVNVVEPHEVVSLALRGGVAGYDKGGNPHQGDFHLHSDYDQASSCKFYIPRQSGTALFLDATESDGMTRTFPLHEYMSEYGYIWDGDQLNDLNMSLEYTQVGITLTIQGWEEEIVVNVVI